MPLRRARILFATVGVVAVGGCRAKPTAPIAATPDAGVSTSGAAARSFYADRFSRKPKVSAETELGRRLFFDTELSASGKMACATCHDPAFAYGPPNDRSTQLGGVDGQSVGLRAAPALRYLQTVPAFAEHHFDEGVDESIDRGPTGGHGWDGRADTTHDQARLPLTSKFEMANADVDSVVARVARGPLASQFRAVFGDDVFSDPVRGSTALLLCLEVFQQSPQDFYPYRSRYDAYLRKQIELNPAELRGLALFNNPLKGNCASCHPSQITHDGFPNFTDFGFNAIGVPRNRALPANADPAFHDLGLCGPVRTDLAGHKDYCGAFRVPSLRNITLRRSFFHNGVFHRLEKVLEFYAERDTDPAKWYAKVDGRVVPFDDLPPAFHKNVNREAPFGGAPGTRPTLGKAEMRDIIAFLATLTDADLTKK
ncbi:MAG TPA: cytochrome c peroxidase [Polyangia bacterium]|nr:cytochrome c peroxidase [Polyangia bacterium]